MTSMLEKMARAVKDALLQIRQPGKEVTYEEIARAALLALREPDEGMDNALLSMAGNELAWDADAAAVQRIRAAMIDTVLEGRE